MIQRHAHRKYFAAVVVCILLSQFACALFGSTTTEADLQATENALSLTQIALDAKLTPEPAETPAQPQPEDQPPAETKEAQYEWGGVTLFYDPELILEIEAQTIEAKTGDEPYETPNPAYTQFSLTLDSGVVLVVPIQDYKAIADFAEGLLAELEALIKQRPSAFGDCIPELPLVTFYHICDHQQFNANVGYLDFQNGSGVRFVTVYGIQDAVPVSNENLVYVFQGITNDGKYYVNAKFRITNSELQDFGAELPPDVYADASGAALQQYFSDYEQALNGPHLQKYQPPLERFDAILKSLRVE
jgi:hypothetical protein